MGLNLDKFLGPIGAVGGFALGNMIAPGVGGPIGASLGGALGGALGASSASEDAAQAQREAAALATGEQARQFDLTRQDQAPWKAAGEASLNKLMGLLTSGELTKKFPGLNPQEEAGYAFAAKEGQRAIDSSASARGGVGTGALRAGARFAEENANRYYNDAFTRFQNEQANMRNPLFQLAGFGPQANQQVGQAGQAYANAAGNNLIGIGNVNAANAINQGNIWGSATNNLLAQANRGGWWNAPGTNLDPYSAYSGQWGSGGPGE